MMNVIVPEVAFGSMLVFLIVLFGCTFAANSAEKRRSSEPK
jgi:hypothetical protein